MLKKTPRLEMITALGVLVLATLIGLPAIAQTLYPVPANYDGIVLSETSATHYWAMSDKPSGCGTIFCTPGPCPSTMADSISAGATANPSPVPLTVATPTASPYPQCGAPGIVKDGETSAYLSNENGQTNDYFGIPGTIISSLCNGNAGGTCTNSFSLECIVETVLTNSNSQWFTGDTTTASNFELLFNLSDVIEVSRGSSATVGAASIAVPYDIVYVASPGVSGATGQLYVNGMLTFANLSVPGVGANTAATYGYPNNSSTYRGRIEKCSTYNVALTQTQVWVHFFASGLP